MLTTQLISLYLMSALYCFAGISHIIRPTFFLKITPKWVPFPDTVNIIVGLLEIAFGITLLFEVTRNYAAVGIILLLIAVFPANVYHFQKAWRKGKQMIPTLIRLPVQGLLIYWAFTFI